MIEVKPFKESYVSMVKDIMLQICLSEYKCQQWGNTVYMQDWRNWILSQKFDYFKFYPQHMLMAFDGNKLVGFISIKKINDLTVEIRRFYVLPEYRNSGIGETLYHQIMDEVNKLTGITNVQILVCAPFLEAINFLTKHGFIITFLDPKKLEYRLELRYEHKINRNKRLVAAKK